MDGRSYPTLRLLNASTVVAISGILRLHIAFLLAGIPPSIPEYCAFALIIYSTYTLDRSLDCAEDTINRSELCGADRKTGLAACLAAFLGGAILLGLDGIYLATFLPFIIGYFYSRGFRIGSFQLKLKGGLGMKNVIIGLTWGGTIALIVARWCGSIQTVCIIFLFYGLKVFVTSSINDFKDVRGDISAGIRTLPAILGEERTKEILIITLVGLYGMMAGAIYLHCIRDEWIVLLFSLVITVAFLVIYSPSFEKSPALVYRKMREFVISWEPVVALGLRACIPG